jgi:thiamine kinase-like enzyme
MKLSLNALPCFNQITNISIIPSGLSQNCFKISADSNVYFAKTITDKAEVNATVSAASFGISPSVFYADQQWLICHYIDANNLAHSKLPIEFKVKLATQLMVQCHQLQEPLEELSPEELTHSLIDRPHYSARQTTVLSKLKKSILASLKNSTITAFCHGDLNFSNLLMNEKQSTWLVDFECACNAPIEFDIAMFIAVNNLDKKASEITIEQYENQSYVKVDQLLLNHYLVFSYFINALWYFNTFHEKTQIEDKQILLKHAEAQWNALHASLLTKDSYLLSSLGIKFTDILTPFNLQNQT